MTVLSDKELKRLIGAKKIVIHPILSENQIRGAKIDLRLGTQIYSIKHLKQAHYSPKSQKEIEIGEKRIINIDDSFILQPGDFVIAPVFERIKIPDNIIGRLDGRISFGRLGVIVHATAGGIDPGYSGIISCELSNVGKVAVELFPLTRIVSLTLEKLDDNAEHPYRTRIDKKYSTSLSTMLFNDWEYKDEIFNELIKTL